MCKFTITLFKITHTFSNDSALWLDNFRIQARKLLCLDIFLHRRRHIITWHIWYMELTFFGPSTIIGNIFCHQNITHTPERQFRLIMNKEKLTMCGSYCRASWGWYDSRGICETSCKTIASLATWGGRTTGNHILRKLFQMRYFLCFVLSLRPSRARPHRSRKCKKSKK